MRGTVAKRLRKDAFLLAGTTTSNKNGGRWDPASPMAIYKKLKKEYKERKK